MPGNNDVVPPRTRPGHRRCVAGRRPSTSFPSAIERPRCSGRSVFFSNDETSKVHRRCRRRRRSEVTHPRNDRRHTGRSNHAAGRLCPGLRNKRVSPRVLRHTARRPHRETRSHRGDRAAGTYAREPFRPSDKLILRGTAAMESKMVHEQLQTGESHSLTPITEFTHDTQWAPQGNRIWNSLDAP
jgi:hypothetical protein